MFDVHADEITFDGRTVGSLSLPSGTLRERIIDALHNYSPDNTRTARECIEQCDEARCEGFKGGIRDAIGAARMLAAEYESEIALGTIKSKRAKRILKRWRNYERGWSS